MKEVWDEKATSADQEKDEAEYEESVSSEQSSEDEGGGENKDDKGSSEKDKDGSHRKRRMAIRLAEKPDELDMDEEDAKK